VETLISEFPKLDQVRLIQAAGTIIIREAAGRSMMQLLETSNPVLAKSAASQVKQSTRRLAPEAAKSVTDSYFRTLVTLEEYSASALSVSLPDRALRLSAALYNIGENRSLEGFGKASDPESRHRTGLIERYQYKFHWIKKGAANKRPGIYNDAKRDFAKGIGHSTAVNSGLIGLEEAKKIASQDFEDFEKKYFTDPDAESQRGKFRRRLNRYIPKV
jgi:hypothetical protein